MQSSQDKRKNFIAILSDGVEQQGADSEAKPLKSGVLALIASLWPRSRSAKSTG
jgi:hypothetical protein